MEPYSPFSKPFRELANNDLQSLRQAAEGWYIEYKQQLVDADSLAKSLSAFSNTHGGWLFLGIKEDSKENPVAGTFPGIPVDEVDKAMKRVRQAAADILAPTPHFELQALYGPCPEIGLATDRAVVCVWIPRSAQAPHVHKSGRIYRRVADSSEPRAENDRFVLDQLWQRADEVKTRHKQWFDRDPEFSKGEGEQPYVRLMLSAEPWGGRDIWIDATPDDIRAAFGASAQLDESRTTTLPFDTVYRSSEGYIARQLASNDPHSHGLTWRLKQTLVSDVIIPLPLHNFTESSDLVNEYHGYLYVERYVRLLRKYKTSSLRIVDLNYLFDIVYGVAQIQARLCELAKWTGTYHLKVKLLNSWRTTPFIDSNAVLTQFEKYGPPMCLDSTSYFPRGTGPDDFLEITRFEEGDLSSQISSASMQIFTPLALMYGIPAWLNEAPALDTADFQRELMEAGRRAMEVQALRNRRRSH